MARRKLASDLMKTSEEYTKLKSTVSPDSTPRENPDHQSPGRGGLDRPTLESWTVEELRRAAETLGLSEADGTDRARLIQALENAGRRRP